MHKQHSGTFQVVGGYLLSIIELPRKKKRKEHGT